MFKRLFPLQLNSGKQFLNAIMPFYAVAKGRKTGIYKSWPECELQTKGFAGAKYKKFKTFEEAAGFVKSISDDGIPSTKPNTESCSADWPEEDDFNDSLLLIAAESAATTGNTNNDNDRKRKVLKNKSAGSSSYESKRPKYNSEVVLPSDYVKFGEYQFPVDSDGYVIAYTDGSCVNNGQKSAFAGFGVYFMDDHPLNAAKPVYGRATNNVGEIQAAIHAVRLAKQHGIKKLVVVTDSQFLMNSIQIWIHSWKRSGWKLKTGGPVKNKTEFVELDGLLADKTIHIKWKYVKGHHGIKGNEMADQLARKGAQIYKRNRVFS